MRAASRGRSCRALEGSGTAGLVKNSMPKWPLERPSCPLLKKCFVLFCFSCRKELLSPVSLNKLQVAHATWNWAQARFWAVDRSPGFSFWATEWMTVGKSFLFSWPQFPYMVCCCVETPSGPFQIYNLQIKAGWYSVWIWYERNNCYEEKFSGCLMPIRLSLRGKWLLGPRGLRSHLKKDYS